MADAWSWWRRESIMNERTFNKLLNACTRRGEIDVSLIGKLENAAKTEMVQYIVRKRWPVLVQLLTPEIDMSWLHACGYLHRTKGEKYEFVHTCEHAIR